MALSIAAMRALVSQGETRPLRWRLEQLGQLEALLDHCEPRLLAALAADLGKPPLEATMELVAVRQELQLTRRQLRRWMAARPLPTALFLQPAQARQISEPLGCVLIISPWNYPFQLCLHPLVSALAAGNTAVLKPSEHTPATSALLAELIAAQFPAAVVQVVEGDGNTAAALLQERFDHIFFTGGERVGQLVMAAAARHLTPVTLELGGKSPAIVLAEANLEVTARRLIWGKGFNAGQTCVAPDYLLVETSVRQGLVEALQRERERLYGSDPLCSPDLGSIVNQAQFNRLEALLLQARQRGQILLGGRSDPDRRRIEPTVVAVADGDDPLMQGEIFGPILPLLSTENLTDALAFINQRPKPLALYLFSGNHAAQQQTLSGTSSGTLCFNDVIVQAGDANLPFGGVGSSGMGRYHGEAGFRTFSHQRTVVHRRLWGDVPLRYPPYAGKLPLLKRFLG
ncbi:MAG: aldehyde dehydrogenase family protein [Cyanobacteriota bacterium]|nr:aldehyde dehydrogenase family protein [Cyanobacteriota bacterium]